MAKDVFEKLASVLKNGRTPTLVYRETLAEAETELARQSEAERKMRSDSTDPTLNPSDRDDAHDGADRAARMARTLADGISRLQNIIEERETSDATKASEAEREAAVAERDELAAHWNAVPTIITQLTDLFARTNANAARMKSAGVFEADAECTARGVTILGVGGGPDRFTRMKIPAWAGRGRAWPPEQQLARSQINYGAERDAALERETRAAKHAEASFGHYRVANNTGAPIIFESRTSPGVCVDMDPWQGEAAHTVIANLRRKFGKSISIEQIDAKAEAA